MSRKRLRLGELLIDAGKINQEDLDQALKIQKKTGKRLGEVLSDEKIISEDEIISVLELQLGIPYIDLDNYTINKDLASLLPESLVRKYELLTIDEIDGRVLVVMVDPLNIFAIDDIKLHLKRDLKPAIGERKKVLALIDKYYSRESAKKAVEEFKENYQPTDLRDFSEEEDLQVSSAPIVRLLNSIINQGVRDGASDIHIEPYEDEIRVRYRIDGDLRQVMALPAQSLSPLITRVKIMGNMNIAERRLPQDGRIEANIESRDIDMRISTIPTIYGEKAVIRLLDRSNFLFSKESLGLSQRDLDVVDRLLEQPYGMILVTGPTGSGKSTTLYTILQELNTVDKNTITVEDPVEYKLKGINQVQVNPKAGLDFASGLRSILRQDPDIIMIGEIRDSETAEIATRAAITGHLVLSTLHTNDSPSTISRLIDMGIEPYLVSSAVIGIISQRLVKTLCNNCKKAYLPDDHERKILKITDKDTILYKPIGCNSCNKGYKGRVAVHEVMPISEKIRELINRSETTDLIRNTALEQGMTSLLDSASKLAKKGITSYDEVIRVGYTLE